MMTFKLSNVNAVVSWKSCEIPWKRKPHQSMRQHHKHTMEAMFKWKTKMNKKRKFPRNSLLIIASSTNILMHRISLKRDAYKIQNMKITVNWKWGDKKKTLTSIHSILESFNVRKVHKVIKKFCWFFIRKSVFFTFCHQLVLHCHCLCALYLQYDTFHNRISNTSKQNLKWKTLKQKRKKEKTVSTCEFVHVCACMLACDTITKQ